MMIFTPGRRPALAISSGLLIGVGLAGSLHVSWETAIVAALVALGGSLAARRTPRLSQALLLGAVSCLGAGTAIEARREAERRVQGWLPTDGGPIELSFKGEVLALPEPGPDGERRLRVRGHPSARRSPQPPVVVQITIPPPPRGGRSLLPALHRGDEVRIWCRLRAPRPLGNPRERDPRIYLWSQGLDAIGSVKSGNLVEKLTIGSAGPLRFLDEEKAHLRRRLDLAFGEKGETRAVLGSMLLGDRALLEPDGLRALRDAGLIHLLVISGFNVGLVVWVLLAFLRRTRFRAMGVFLIVSCGIVVFGYLTGSQPPVLRAVLAAGIHLLGRTLGRDGDALNTLAFVAAALVAFSPPLLMDPGFQLSFLATAGILTLSRPLAEMIPLPRFLASFFAVSASAYLSTAPIIAWHFGRLTPVALLSNLAGGPLCAVLLGLGFVAVLFAGVPLAGTLLAWAAGACVKMLLAIASVAATMPGGVFRACAPSAWMALLYAVLLIGTFASRLPEGVGSPGRWNGEPDQLRRPPPRWIRSAFCLVFILLHLGPFPPGPRASSVVEIVDVGQGQSVLVRGPSGRFLLIDAAGASGGRYDVAERVLAPFLARQGCRRLEVLALTHDHDDHAGGSRSILREFDVGELWIAVGAIRDPLTHEIVDDAVSRGVAVVLAERGMRVARAGLPVEVLHPTRCDRHLPINDRCLAVRIGEAPNRVLIPGDLESQGETELLEAGPGAASEALVVGHHGARNSTTQRFLTEIGPSVAAISVGAANRFGHPSVAVLERLSAANIPVFRTDRDGLIRLTSAPFGWRAEGTLNRSRTAPE